MRKNNRFNVQRTALCGLLFYLWMLPYFIQLRYPDNPASMWLCLALLWLSALPCYAVLIDGWRIARRIGTFDTSILPYEDCCTVFTPRHPKTHPVIEEVREIEAALDVDALVARAMEQTEIVKVSY